MVVFSIDHNIDLFLWGCYEMFERAHYDCRMDAISVILRNKLLLRVSRICIVVVTWAYDQVNLGWYVDNPVVLLSLSDFCPCNDGKLQVNTYEYCGPSPVWCHRYCRRLWIPVLGSHTFSNSHQGNTHQSDSSSLLTTASLLYNEQALLLSSLRKSCAIKSIFVWMPLSQFNRQESFSQDAISRKYELIPTAQHTYFPFTVWW